MTLTLTVLGCDGSHAGPGGAASGYLVRHRAPETALWLDAGPGTFANLQNFCDPAGLDAVVLSHAHPDHWSDLQGLVTAMRWTWRLQRPPLRVLAAPGVAEALGADVSDVLAWEEVGEQTVATVGALSLRFSRTDHPPPTFAARVEGGGRALGYSADSGPGWSLEALGPGIDLALCEATYTAEYEGTVGHMSGRQAGESARRAGAGRLVLTHRWPTVPAADLAAEAAAAFGGDVAQAAVGRGFTV